MAKIRTGEQHGESESINEFVVSPQGNLEVEMGDQYDKSKRKLNVREEGGAPPVRNHTDRPQVENHADSATLLWAKGSFFLVAFATVAAVIGIMAFKLAWYLVPISVVGAVIVLYLLATVLVPNGPLTEKGLLSVLQAYVRLAFTLSPEPKSKRNNKAR